MCQKRTEDFIDFVFMDGILYAIDEDRNVWFYDVGGDVSLLDDYDL